MKNCRVKCDLDLEKVMVVEKMKNLYENDPIEYRDFEDIDRMNFMYFNYIRIKQNKWYKGMFSFIDPMLVSNDEVEVSINEFLELI